MQKSLLLEKEIRDRNAAARVAGMSGASLLGDVCGFRVWAPDARRVRLRLLDAHGACEHELLPSGRGKGSQIKILPRRR